MKEYITMREYLNQLNEGVVKYGELKIGDTVFFRELAGREGYVKHEAVIDDLKIRSKIRVKILKIADKEIKPMYKTLNVKELRTN